MAENVNSGAAPQQPEAQQQAGHCTGNCKMCTLFQRQYCASQISYNNMRMLERMEQEIVILKGITRKLNEKLEAIQNNEAMLMDPIAQEGDGAGE
jgi:hypothetical protein